MFLNSIRWRLQLWHGLLLIVVLAGFGLTAYQLQRINQLKRIDQELQRRMAAVTGMIRRPGEGVGRPPLERMPLTPRPAVQPLPPPGRNDGAERLDRRNHLPEREGQGDVEPNGPVPGGAELPRAPFEGQPRVGPEPPLGPDFALRNPLPPAPIQRRLSPEELNLFEGSATNAYYYVVWARDGWLLSRSDSAPQDIPQPPRGTDVNETRVRGARREMFRYMPPGECLLVGKDVERDLAELRGFAGLLLAAGGAVLVVGLAGGWWLSTRAIRPIDDISATALKISSGDLSLRIPAADTDNELDQLASVLNSTFARLEAAFGQQARFTSDAAHELRTPVSVMLTQTQSALTRERAAAEYRETVEACQRAAQRMRGLIESLLELASLDAGQEPLKRARFDLAQTAAECLELVRPLAAERRITLHADLAAAECLGDADRVALVITNLLTNAVFYNRDGGEVRISTRSDGGTVTLCVSDTGQGVCTEDLPHVFERFWRADPSRSRAQGRTGLGLAIAKSIVELHSGSIEAASELGKGSTFTVRLPGTS